VSRKILDPRRPERGASGLEHPPYGLVRDRLQRFDQYGKIGLGRRIKQKDPLTADDDRNVFPALLYVQHIAVVADLPENAFYRLCPCSGRQQQHGGE
jgi:hypothetical protein